ncbi:GNAT family N-acetyltransferase [Streptomyces marincola]|uniref:GNAT family N-acetyltransferase n=1 Tax=Streptomyces marincola TaxID=2878388 RepID=UPI001CF18AFF|nr:GNAT family protein [Streptomyces marincola]UCM87416.1 GNAT family N-acetyltransferase [Streptomyces marincola]
MSERVGLRDVEPGDVEVFFAQEQDPEAARRADFPPRERDAFMAHWRTRVLGDPTVLVQAVTVDGELAGNVVAWWQEERRFLGYWLGRRYWGRGVGTRALALFLARETTRPLYADPFAGNTGSLRLLEKHGFSRVGTVRYGGSEHVLMELPATAADGSGAPGAAAGRG